MGSLWFMGEALIDFVPTQSAEGEAFAPRPGGSPFNAAKAAAQAGAPVGFVGAISTDMFGETLLADLQVHHVNTDNTPRSDAPSTLAFVALADGIAKYAFFNAVSATALMDPASQAFTPRTGDILSFGSISLIDNPGADNLTAFAQAQDDSVLISLDPNARPSMTPDIEAWRARIDAISAKAGIIRLSDEDLEFFAPGQSANDFAAARLAQGAGLVVVTLGDQGVLGFCNNGPVTVPGQTVDIVDTVGAGDTLMGSLLAELMLRKFNTKSALARLSADALGDILRYGVMAAAMNCEHTGCAPPARADVLARMAKSP